MADGNTEITEVHGDREIDGELCASAPPKQPPCLRAISDLPGASPFFTEPLCNENNLNNCKDNLSLARGLSTFAKATVDESRPCSFAFKL